MRDEPTLRVLYVHHRAEGGGAPTSLALLIEGLGDQVEAMVLCPGGAAAEQFRNAGAEVVEAPVAGFNHNWCATYRGTRLAVLGRDAMRVPSHVRALRRVIRDFHPDIVHLNELSLLPAADVAGRHHLPIVWHVRAALPSDDLPDTRLVRWAVARRAAVAIAINRDVAATYGTPPNMKVVHNPLRLPRLDGIDRSGAKRALGLRSEAIVVGMLSKLYGKKGWRDLLEAVAYARREGADLQVVFVGGGVRASAWYRTIQGRLLAKLARLEDSEQEIRRSIDRLGLRDAAYLLDFRQDVSSIFQAIDIVCAPSQGPELGRPILEGQAHGLPVIATGSVRGGGIIEHGLDGLIVPAGDIHALASALVQLVDDPGLRERLGEQARRTAERNYAHTAVAGRVLGLYRCVLERGVPTTACGDAMTATCRAVLP